jgi:uncharacterized membrane protein (Fun14 family)
MSKIGSSDDLLSNSLMGGMHDDIGIGGFLGLKQELTVMHNLNIWLVITVHCVYYIVPRIVLDVFCVVIVNF